MQHHHHASDDHGGVSGLGDVTCRYGCETAACGQPGIMPEKGGRQRTNAHHRRSAPEIGEVVVADDICGH